MKPSLVFPLTLALSLAAAAAPAPAQTVISTGESLVEPRLLVGERRADGTREAGLELTVREGWKTYWRSPGEAGVAPSFDWSGSENLAGVEIGWPVPEVFESFGLRTAGYSGRVVLPLSLTPENPERPIELSLEASLGVCREICVLEEFDLGTGVSPQTQGPGAAAIEAAFGALPLSDEAAGVTRLSCRLSGAGRDRQFEASLAFDRPLSAPFVVLEGPERAWFHDTEVRHQGNRVEIGSTLSLPSENAWVERSSIRLTVLDPNLAADIRGCEAG